MGFPSLSPLGYPGFCVLASGRHEQTTPKTLSFRVGMVGMVGFWYWVSGTRLPTVNYQLLFPTLGERRSSDFLGCRRFPRLSRFGVVTAGTGRRQNVGEGLDIALASLHSYCGGCFSDRSRTSWDRVPWDGNIHSTATIARAWSIRFQLGEVVALNCLGRSYSRDARTDE